MFANLLEYFQFAFFQRAIIVGILVAISSAFLGTFLVLKKYSMIGDGLAHVSFASVALALLLDKSPLLISIPIVILAAILIIVLNEKANVHGDAAIGLISAFSMATGIIIIGFGNGFNVDINSYLFGNILTTSTSDVILSLVLTIFVLASVVLFYHQLFSLTYDEDYAKVNAINTHFANYLLSILTAITIVLGIRIVGTMLISSMIIFPTVTALQFTRGFKQTMIYSAIISILAVVLGFILTISINTSPGASIVVVNGVLFFLAYFYRFMRKL